jgi:actin-related protein
MGLRALYETLAHVLFRSFNVPSVYFVLGNALPMYTTGMESAVIVDIGF